MSTITPKRDAPAPWVGTLDLDTYFHEIRETVLKLEQAYRENSLAHVIEEERIEARLGKPLADCYRELIHRPVLRDPRGHRADAVQGLLCQLRDELKGMSTWCYAKPHGRVDAELDASEVMKRLPFAEDALFCVEPANSQRKSIVMSFGQMIEARAWGIGFVFNHDCLTEAYVDKAVRKSVSDFVRDLADLGRLLPRVLRAPDRYPPIVPPRYSRQFEQLIADILNEHSQHATLSRLIEDYCEKTDLRVQYDGLHRTRGARVQVTFLYDESRHTKKADAIPNQDEFVILSPWSLACAVPGLHSTNGVQNRASFGRALLHAFWTSIKCQPSDTAELSTALKDIFARALRNRTAGPRGPMVRVPRAVREFIRVWVRSEAFRSTRVVRVREAIRGHASPCESSRKLTQFLMHYPEGTKVPALVSRVLDREVWVELPFNLPGQVRQFELSWSDPRAEAQDLLRPGQTTELVVMRPFRSSLGPAIELSLKRSLARPGIGQKL